MLISPILLTGFKIIKIMSNRLNMKLKVINTMKRKSLLPSSHYDENKVVPKKVRLEVYERAIEIIEKDKDGLRTIGTGLCLLLPCILWDLNRFTDCKPNGEPFRYKNTKCMFPELTKEILDEIKCSDNISLDSIRLKHLNNFVNKLQNVKPHKLRK